MDYKKWESQHFLMNPSNKQVNKENAYNKKQIKIQKTHRLLITLENWTQFS